MNDVVRSVATWDPDGAGPQPAQLVAGGRFTTASGVIVNRIARWNGAAWQPLGTGMNGTVLALTTWDPDGGGPATAQLVAGGQFTSAGGVAVNYIARWDGATWQSFGAGMGGPGIPEVRALTTWDPDGAGPSPAQLVAGGWFTTAGSNTVNYIARWDGTAWQPFGTGMGQNLPVHSVTTRDPDGSGPLPAELVAGGTFATAGGVTVNYIARWNGTAWQPFGSGLSNQVYALATLDSDGAGPLAPQLIAGGSFTSAGSAATVCIARWDDAAWQPFGTGLNDLVYALTPWDPDGVGPLPTQLVVGGSFTAAGSVAANRIARWDGTTWHPLGTGMNNIVNTLATWDPDDSGPLPAQVVAGGTFLSAGGVETNYIARWDGTAWQPMGTGTNLQVESLTTWDPDGAGPLHTQLVAGGQFTTAGGVTVNYIARWNGAAWQPFGSGMSGVVSSLTTWDPDGTGPLSAQLVAGGRFVAAGGATVNGIARWDGASWQSLGQGVTGGNSPFVFSLASWKPNDVGALPASLMAGGGFTTAGGVAANFIARWDGSAWQSLGTGMGPTSSSFVRSLTAWDPDGAGPSPTQLVAGGHFREAGGSTVNYLALWDGTAWQALGNGIGGVLAATHVDVLATWDADGAGPHPAQLVLGGSLTAAGGVPSSMVALFGCSSPASCPADLDNGSGSGQSDGAVTIDDLLYFLVGFESGSVAVDLDNDGDPVSGTPDGAVTIDDLLFFLARFESGC